MSGVVIRCPNCGTTQAALGECEACHHADVGYYCPNHSPGRWLDAPACADCGARLGAAPPVRGGTSPTPPRSAPTAPGRVTWEPPATPPPGSRPPRPTRERPTFGGPSRAPAEPPIRGPVLGPEWTPVAPADAARVVARSAMGCIARLVIFILVLFLLASLLVGGFLSGAFGAAPSDAGRVHLAALPAASAPWPGG